MINNFQYFTPTKVYFGKGTEEKAGEYVKAAGGSRVLLHYGGQSAVRSGLLARVEASLKASGIPYVSLGGVVPNPRLSKVYEGIELGRKEGVDFILAVGGGSVIDSSKAIALGLADERDVWDYYDFKRDAAASLPVGCILTIAAAGSEMSDGSVITNDKTGEKRGYGQDIMRCRFAVMNPELTMTLPDYQTMSGCVDMMMHMMERYFTNGGNMEVTDGMAESIMRNVMKYAKILHADPKNYDARAEIMWAGSLAHNGLLDCGIVNGGDWSSHQLEHEMGGMFDVTHGAGLAAIWGSWARYVCKDCMPRFVKFALNVMCVEPGGSDEETAVCGIEALEAFYRSIDMPTNMKELGIAPTDAQCREMAERCEIACGGSQGSAKVLYADDMEKIYLAARG